MDEMVRRAQAFVNSVYSDHIGVTVDENGITGWDTMYALTRALQYELGISPVSDNFGPTTLATLTARYPVLNSSTVPSSNLCKIIQSGMYCKGYDGGEIDGTYNSRVQAAMSDLKTDMGVNGLYPGSDLTPKVFKGLLNMDPYITVNDGSDAVRSVQRWLNGRYTSRQDFFIIPCDGHNSRDVAKSMLLAIQYELGLADGAATGVFGPTTQAGLRSHPVSNGSQGIWVSLFSAAMILGSAFELEFSDRFDDVLDEAVGLFQSFVALPVTHVGDFPTWASLLISYGDQSRQGAACDGVTLITDARAAALKAAGIKYVGRYLTNPSTTQLPEKAIQPGELQTIAGNGLRCFPIYQTYGGEASVFTYVAGRTDGQAAVNAALDHGFKAGTRIYFAVDFDALDADVTSNVLPYFKGVRDALADDGNRYQIGVYGPRNVCTRVAQAGYSSASFVSDLSSGYSGNFGYTLPSDWAYDQFVTRTTGNGDGAINIDNDIVSGRDLGQASFNTPRLVVPDTALDTTVIEAMRTDVGKYMEAIGAPADGGLRSYSHEQCFQATVVDHDSVITQLSNRYNMRKALIQTSAYWEMRHIDPADQAADDRVMAEYELTGVFADSSTGIAQCQGKAALAAWNYCIEMGYVAGAILDPGSPADLYSTWLQLHDSQDFDLRTVCMVHLWDAGGKPGGDHDEEPLRTVRLDYTETEIFEVLRRYQGFGDDVVADAHKRMGIYEIMEKYNGISRN
jgi:peptidoglycan hydrolase-like protein with peptidoglycan-binding domain